MNKSASNQNLALEMANKGRTSSHKSSHRSKHSSSKESKKSKSRYVVKKEPYEEDLRKREHANKANNNDVVSELSDGDLDIGFDKAYKPKEIIFAELNEGSYFGELSLSYKGKSAAKAAC